MGGDGGLEIRKEGLEGLKGRRDEGRKEGRVKGEKRVGRKA